MVDLVEILKEKCSVSIDNWEVKTAGNNTWHRQEVKDLVRNYAVYKIIERYPTYFFPFNICLLLELLLGIF